MVRKVPLCRAGPGFRHTPSLPAQPQGLMVGTCELGHQGKLREKPQSLGSGAWTAGGFKGVGHGVYRARDRAALPSSPGWTVSPLLCSTSVPRTATCAHSVLCPQPQPSRSAGSPSPGLRPPRLTCPREHLHLLRLPQPHSHPLQHTGYVIAGSVQAVVLHIPTHRPAVRGWEPGPGRAGSWPAPPRTPPACGLTSVLPLGHGQLP